MAPPILADAADDASVDGASDAGDDAGADTAGADAAPDALGTCSGNMACSFADGGPGGLCKAGQCAACVDVADDAACVTAYGANHLCVGGLCVPGVCRTSATCAAGEICDTTSRLCTACTMDAQCTGDARYGAGHICVSGACVMGNCRTSADCTGGNAGKICGVQAANTCGNCTGDQQCQGDSTYGANTICNTATGQCVANTCTTAGTVCPVNAADFCCNVSGSNKCVPGNCCDNSQCGVGNVCLNNLCTNCQAVSGNTYYVDPVNGNDQTANGSGKLTGGASSAQCSFRTITRALQIIPNPAPAGTTIVVVGSGSSTPLSATETWPITIRTNVTLTTSGGPISANVSSVGVTTAFTVTGSAAAIAPMAAAPLTIDGPNYWIGAFGGTGVTFAAGADGASISNTTIQNSRGNGIVVQGGTVSIGNGVTVQNAGVPGAARSGLAITAGTVTINVTSGTPVSFKNNTQFGISVTNLGVLNITGTPTLSGNPAFPTGAGTVVASSNAAANIAIAQRPGLAPATSNLTGVVGWAGLRGHQIGGGSRVKVRGSVFLANGDAGIRIGPGADTVAGNDLSGIDLGAAGDAGGNWIQATLGSNPNINGGLCVLMSTNLANVGMQTLKAVGNIFRGPRNCATTPGSLVVNAPSGGTACVGQVDIAVSPRPAPPETRGVTADVTMCTMP
jgi:hypothetical protein